MEPRIDICWDENALRSMRKIFQFLDKNVSNHAATLFRSSVFEAVETLLEQPERYGYDRILMETPPKYRSIPLGKYRIVYELTSEAAIILVIYHTSQNPEKVKKMTP